MNIINIIGDKALEKELIIDYNLSESLYSVLNSPGIDVFDCGGQLL